jgi:hypothetical protein
MVTSTTCRAGDADPADRVHATADAATTANRAKPAGLVIARRAPANR